MDNKWFIQYHGQSIPVSEDVYWMYKRFVWTEEKREKREMRCIDENGVRCTKDCKACPKKLDDTVYSLNTMLIDGFDTADSSDIAKIVEDKLLLDTLLASLEAKERFVITGKYLKGKTERELATSLGISQPMVHKLIRKILEKLRNMLS